MFSCLRPFLRLFDRAFYTSLICVFLCVFLTDVVVTDSNSEWRARCRSPIADWCVLISSSGRIVVIMCLFVGLLARRHKSGIN